MYTLFTKVEYWIQVHVELDNVLIRVGVLGVVRVQGHCRLIRAAYFDEILVV